VKARVSIHSDFKIATIDERIYGAFLEHLGRAVYGGIYEPGHKTADEDGFRGDVLDLVRDLRPPLVRYPGGNFVSAYNWEDGIGDRKDRPVRLDLAWRSLEPNWIGTNEFVKWCAKAGTEAMLAVNLGSRDLDAARHLLEYCNHPGGTYWSDLRVKHGYKKPHNIRHWCLGNEMDGPWQVGHKTAHEYGRVAHETAKAMRAYDKDLQLIVCGSSHSYMPTYPEWEQTVLTEAYNEIDHVSLHMYFANNENDYLNFMARTAVLDRYINTVGGIIDYAKAKNRSKRNVTICFDEWNVWYHSREQDKEVIKKKEWTVAPEILEDIYNFEDVLVVGAILNTFIRRADRVKIACIAQLVNVIAPIMTETGGGAWKQSTYYPLYYASLYGRGDALNVSVDVPTYSATVAEDVPYLDVAAVRSADGRTLTFFIVNRHPKEDMALDVAMSGFDATSIIEHVQMIHTDLKATNTVRQPNRVAPSKGKGMRLRDGALKGKLPPKSYHMIRVAI
jgi:alpha-N-arabinofuranosidase